VKTTALILIAFLTGLDLRAQMPPNLRPVPQRFSMPATNAAASAATNMATVPPALPLPPALLPVPATPPPASELKEETVPAGDINFQGVDLDQVLDVYARYVGRTLLRANLPQVKIILHTETSLTRSEVIQALQAVLALNGVALINVGDKFVKAVPAAQANQEAAPFNKDTAAQLPDVGQYVTHIVQLKYVKPSEMTPILQPFAKLQNSILSIDSNGILVLRDNAENVKRMLEMIDQVDVSVPAEYISEVIPIKYALADDIASALNSLGGSGGGTVSIGNSGTASSTISGIGTRTGGTTTGTMGQSTTGQYQPNQSRTTGSQTTANGTPTSGNSFSQRLQSIIQRASSGTPEQIQIFGQTKIIADDRSNSLLVFATRPDMERIKEIVGKLDVLLSQVLIEAVIIDYQLGPNTFNFGVSAAQNPAASTIGNTTVAGAGGMNNGPSFFNFLSTNSTFNSGTNSSAIFGNVLSGGLSYFGNIGPNWDVAVQAAATDSHASVIQRPRIQTSQAKAAQFFVGETVPYVTSTYNGGSVSGNSSSYSQLSVGVELDVTPFINPDGLVVMDINQEIDDIDGFTTIEGVGNIPNTDKRTLSSEIAVRNGDTVMLGGFIKNQKSTSKSGVPFLMDIPLLGNLFSSRSDSKQREELIVMIRPTVLKTPELAAAQAVKEKERLPGVSAALAEEIRNEHKLVEAEKKVELKNAEEDQKRIDDPRTWLQRHAPLEHNKSQDDHSNPVSPVGSINTNTEPQFSNRFRPRAPVSPDGSVNTNAVVSPNP
jgi:general secretion pathway protein D